jgi:histone H3/H4
MDSAPDSDFYEASGSQTSEGSKPPLPAVAVAATKPRRHRTHTVVARSALSVLRSKPMRRLVRRAGNARTERKVYARTAQTIQALTARVMRDADIIREYTRTRRISASHVAQALARHRLAVYL